MERSSFSGVLEGDHSLHYRNVPELNERRLSINSLIASKEFTEAAHYVWEKKTKGDATNSVIWFLQNFPRVSLKCVANSKYVFPVKHREMIALRSLITNSTYMEPVWDEDKVAFRTFFNRFWSATASGEVLPDADKIAPGPHELFSVVLLRKTETKEGRLEDSGISSPKLAHISGTCFALKTFNGNYIGLSNTGDSQLICKTKLSRSALFQPYAQVGIKTLSKKYLSADSKTIKSASALRTNEVFTFELEDYQCSIITANNTFISADKYGNVSLQTPAISSRKSDQECFTLECHVDPFTKEKKFAIKSFYGKYLRFVESAQAIVATGERPDETSLFFFKLKRNSKIKGFASPLTHRPTIAQSSLIFHDGVNYLTQQMKRSSLVLSPGNRRTEELQDENESDEEWEEEGDYTFIEEVGEPVSNGLTPWQINMNELQISRKILGIGFFGKVYLANWKGTPVAVKFIYRDHFRSKNEEDLFRREVEILSSLHHPCIVQFLGVAYSPERHCIVTEWMSAGSLFDFLRRDKELLSDSQRWQIAVQTAQGMCYMHSRQPPILHRDLTTKNVLLQGVSYHAKVSDFGLSSAKGDKMSGSVGALLTLAPEVYSGSKYAESSDVFSFGVVLWELFSAEDPTVYNFDEELTTLEYVAKVVLGYRPPYPPHCPVYWQTLINACWDGDRDKRPSFSAILKELQKFPEGDETSFEIEEAADPYQDVISALAPSTDDGYLD